MTDTFTFVPADDPQLEDDMTALDNTKIYIQHCFDGSFMIHEVLSEDSVSFHPDVMSTLPAAKKAAIKLRDMNNQLAAFAGTGDPRLIMWD